MFLCEIHRWSRSVWIWRDVSSSRFRFLCVFDRLNAHMTSDERMNVRSLPPLACMPNLNLTLSLDVTWYPASLNTERTLRLSLERSGWLHHLCTRWFKERRCWNGAIWDTKSCWRLPTCTSLEDTNRPSPSVQLCDTNMKPRWSLALRDSTCVCCWQFCGNGVGKHLICFCVLLMKHIHLIYTSGQKFGI